MKKLFYFAFMAMLCCGFVACGGDDDNGGGDTQSIVGTWKSVFSSGYQILHFTASGTGYYQEYDEDDGGLDDKEYFTYSYNERSQRLTLMFEDYYGVEIEIYNVHILTDTRLVIQYDSDYDEDIEEWYRID